MPWTRTHTVRSFFPMGILSSAEQSLPTCPHGHKHELRVNTGEKSMPNIGILSGFCFGKGMEHCQLTIDLTFQLTLRERVHLAINVCDVHSHFLTAGMVRQAWDMSIYVPPYIIPPGLGTPPPSLQGSPTPPPPELTPPRSSPPDHRYLLQPEQGQGIMGPPERVIEDFPLFQLQYYAASLISPHFPVETTPTQTQTKPARAAGVLPGTKLGQHQSKTRSSTQVIGKRIVRTAMEISGRKLWSELHSQRIGGATAVGSNSISSANHVQSGSSGGHRVVDRTYLLKKGKRHFELLEDVMVVKDKDTIIVIEQ